MRVAFVCCIAEQEVWYGSYWFEFFTVVIDGGFKRVPGQKYNQHVFRCSGQHWIDLNNAFAILLEQV